jgi:hypothetical protein
MSSIRTLIHDVDGDYLHARDLITHLLRSRDDAHAAGDRASASALDRVIVNIATPLMLRDRFQPLPEHQSEEAPSNVVPLHTEQETPVAHA